jgi:hypothetical protein
MVCFSASITVTGSIDPAPRFRCLGVDPVRGQCVRFGHDCDSPLDLLVRHLDFSFSRFAPHQRFLDQGVDDLAQHAGFLLAQASRKGPEPFSRVGQEDGVFVHDGDDSVQGDGSLGALPGHSGRECWGEGKLRRPRCGAEGLS